MYLAELQMMKKKIQHGKKLDNTIWKLNLPTMKWSCYGQAIGISKLDNIKNVLFNNNQKKKYLINNEFNIINPTKNTLVKYELNYTSKIYSNYFEGNKIIFVGHNNLKVKKYFTIIPIDNLIGKQLATFVFIKPCSYYNSLIILILSLALCIILLLFRKKIIDKLKPFEGILYNLRTNQFLYKNKPITIFDEQEKRLLLFILEQNNQFVSLNNLNQLFENNNQPETISATVKRREQTVSRLLAKVSKMTGFEVDVLILEQKNSEDKRIKDLKILPNLLKSE